MSLDKSDARLILVLHYSGEGAGKTQLRIVSWNGKKPVLEKRAIVKDQNTGESRVGRCLGLTLEELNYVVGNFPDVQRGMLDADAKNSGALNG